MSTIEKLEDLIYNGFKETDRKFQETDRLFKATQKESHRQMSELKQHLQGVSDSLGLFAENMTLASVSRLFRERGFELTDIGSRMRSRYNGETMEFDIICNGPSVVIAIEVKHRLRQWNIERALDKLTNFSKFYQRYRGLTLYGAVAGMSIDAEVDRFAYKQGLFVLSLSQENMKIWNDESFEPRAFNDASQSSMPVQN